jgi:hypothetical protein
MGLLLTLGYLKITELVQMFGLFFTFHTGYQLILAKLSWATFWAFLVQTHLVILLLSHQPMYEHRHQLISIFNLKPVCTQI